MEVHPELNASVIIDLPDDELMQDISAMGTSEVESKISAFNQRQRVIMTKKKVRYAPLIPLCILVNTMHLSYLTMKIDVKQISEKKSGEKYTLVKCSSIES